MRLFIITLFIFYANVSVAVECRTDRDRKERSRIVRDGLKQLKRLGLNIKLPVNLIQDFDPAYLKITPQIRIQNGFYNHFYTRIESISANLGAIPTQIKDIVDRVSPLSWVLDKGVTVHYGRQFDCLEKAVLSPLKNFYHFPRSSKLVLEKMQDYDFFIIESKMFSTFGVEFSHPAFAQAGHAFEASADMKFGQIGNFALQIIKLPNKRIKLRLVNTGKKVTSAEIGQRFFDYQQFIESDFGSDVLESNMSGELFSANLQKVHDGDVILTEYVLNFYFPEVREAFDKVLKRFTNPFKLISSVRSKNPIFHDNDNHLYLVNTEALDAIHFNDQFVHRDLKRVNRAFQAAGIFKENQARLTLGNRLAKLRFQRRKISTKALIKESHKNHKDQISYDMWENDRQGALFFNLREERKKAQVYYLKDDKEDDRFIFTYLNQDRILSNKEKQKAFKVIRRFGSSRLDQFMQRFLSSSSEDEENAGIYFRVIVNKSFFERLQSLTSQEIYQKLLDRMRLIYKDETAFLIQKNYKDLKEYVYLIKSGEMFHYLNKLKKKLHKKLTMKNWFFRELGLSPYLDSDQQGHYYLDFDYSSSEFRQAQYYFEGSQVMIGFLDQLELLQSSLLDFQDLDLRLIYRSNNSYRLK